VIFKGNALHLIEEHHWVVVAYNAVRRNACVTEIENEKGRVVLERQEARDNVAVVAIRRVVAKGRSRHGDDPVGDVSQVHVKAICLVAALVLRHSGANLRRDCALQLVNLAHVYEYTEDAQAHGNAPHNAQRRGRRLR